jgi:hypothetical protein
MKFTSFFVAVCFLYSCTNLENEAEMLADYCYCQSMKAKSQEEKNLAKRQCNDLKNQIEKQHGKDLANVSEEDRERFNTVFFERLKNCE